MTHPIAVPTIADLWRTLRAWLAGALRFRGPAAILHTLSRRAERAIKARLRLIESLLLKLLLIEAACLQGPLASSRHPFSTPIAVGGGECHAGWKPAVPGEDPAHPETWRVLFRPKLASMLRAPRKLARHCVPKRHVVAADSATRARKLARRLEALRRVIANPRPAIAALARRLHALGANARAVAHAIANARPRRPASSIPLAAAIVHAWDAIPAFDNSS